MPLTRRPRLREPYSAGEFAAFMRAAGPFEPAPQLAVGVSGGPDSMALIGLAADWARAQGGAATALVVDHGLRPGSRTEAGRVARWLDDRRIARRILRWRGPKPGGGVQAAARAARYDLMTGWCRRSGVLHLLLGHQRDDQAETLLMRLARGSGADGLACMPPVLELPWTRLLRPLLDVPRERLLARLEALGEPWIDDPTNRDPVHARARLRRAMIALDDDGATAGRLAGAAAKLGRARQALDRQTARFLSRAVAVHPAGFCRLAAGALADEPPEIGLRALSRLLLCVGGLDYPPRGERLERLYVALAGGAPMRGRTLGGCLIAPRAGGLLVTREPSAATHRLALAPGADVVWDRRFRVVRGRGRAAASGAPATLARLGREGWTEARSAGVPARLDPRLASLPTAAAQALPALWDDGELLAVPSLGLLLPGAARRGGLRTAARFWPGRALAGAEFSVVSFGDRIIGARDS